ncbi:RHS repeat domain-containing protein [Tunturibacter empetritectus]|uniref:RHS repeat-associated protein n=1 Tax=Tunturiibacter lichenicola TaxID=2051959 RepID=A0A7W8J8I0_9BACT|nr:RHS repeat-associated core domain-containing protein [Edaphobacter lichenicola]MBB5344471.1 RHS repeat-associated protein [Edaphobacter lichenicola]
MRLGVQNFTAHLGRFPIFQNNFRPLAQIVRDSKTSPRLIYEYPVCRKGDIGMVRITVCAARLLVVVLLLGSSFGHAQAAPGVYADEHNPSGTPVPQNLDAVWDVDHLTGTLSVKIPFPTGPAGGRGPRIPFTLLYNSSSTVTLQQTDVHTTNGTIIDFGWIPGSYNAPAGPTGPWSTTGPFLTSNATTIPDYTPVYGNGTTGPTVRGCQIFGPYLYSDENGATHDMDIAYVSGIGANPNSQCTEYQNSPTNGYIGDGLSIRTSIPGLGPNIGITTKDGYGPPLIYPNGTQYWGEAKFWQHGQLEDANGNTASLTQDSAGRPAFTTTFPIAQVGPIPAGTYTLTTRDANGANETYTITVTTIPIGGYTSPHPTDSELSNLDPSGTMGNVTGHVQPMSPSTTTAVTSISLPDGTSLYRFTYHPTWGTIQQITFPTGGYVKFNWGIRGDCGGYGSFNYISCVVVKDSYISSGSGENHWNYSFPSYVFGSNQLTSKISDPDGYTNYVGKGFTNSIIFPQGAPSFREISRNRYDSSNHLLESVYGDTPPLPSQIVTTVYDGSTPLQRQVQMRYDTYSNVIEKDESDYYACSGSPCTVASSPPNGWLRKTLTNYLWNNPNSTQRSYPYLQAFIVDKPSQITVTDGAGNPFSMVQYNYDEFPLSGSAGILNHDDANYPATMIGPRGNLTSEKHCILFSGGICSSWQAPSIYKYDIAGMRVSAADPKGNTTNYEYSNANVVGSPSTPIDAYATKVTRPTTGGTSHVDSYTYNYFTGSVASHTDENSQVTQFQYDDPLNRIRKVIPPSTVDGTTNQSGNGTSSINYTDSSAGWSVQKQVLQDTNGTAITNTDSYDGLGRLSTTILTDPGGNITVTRDYDPMGRLLHVSNPFRTITELTYGITTYGYDPLSRKILQTQPDNSTQSWLYNANSVIFTDESGNQWKRTNDGLGRLKQVLEPSATSPTPTLETDYSYDSLNNLVGVYQKGAGNELPRVRSFTYDSLSRLICASNPESSSVPCPTAATSSLPQGVVSYSYDADGNVITKTDARGLSVIYAYDALNRLLSKTPSPQNGATYLYNYDEKTVAWNTFALTNTIGRLSSSSAIYGGVYSRYSYYYDAMGRQAGRHFQLPNATGTSVNTSTGSNGANYDLAGNVTFIDNGGGIYITVTRDAAGHAMAASSNKATTGLLGTVYSHQIFANATYSPFGTLASRTLGNGLTENRTYDKRGRVLTKSQFNADSSIGYNVALTYYPNGNVNSANDSINGNWTYTYYPLNQLKGATSAAGLILGWTYDSFGNRKTQTASGTGSAPQSSFTYSGNNNRADASGGFSYDAAGNVTIDNLGQHYYYYPDDSIGRVDTLGGTSRYRYDSEGHLAFENGPNGAQVFLYDQNGQILSNNNLTSGYVVQSATIDGEKIGSWQPNQFFWAGTDWLGTKRYESAGQGDIGSQAVPISPTSYTSLPFGDALSSLGNDPTHFTGKERDAESGLDYFGARYYGSSMGRWMSPDWSEDPDPVPYANLENPQSLNLYGYVENNPLSRTDPDGHYRLNPDCACNQPVDFQFLWHDFIQRSLRFNAAVSSYWNQYFGKSKPVAPPIATPANTANPNPDDKDKKTPTGEKPKTLQTGSNTVRKATADALNKTFDEDLTPREWGRALESLKSDEGLPNDFHGKIMSNGDVSGVVNGIEKTIGNIGDHIP